MAEKEPHVYANLNSYPVLVKNRRRATVTVNPREVVRGSWFSRYTGKHQLTQIDNTSELVPDGPLRGTEGPRTCRINCQTGCETSIQGLENFEHYKYVAGTYFCKYCTNSESKKQMIEMHVKNEHPEEAESQEAPEAVAEDEVDEGVVGELEKEFEPNHKEIDEAGEYFWKLKSGLFRCKECGKDCKSKAGLASHINAKHR